MHALPAGSHLHEPQMGFIFINIFIFLFPPLLRALYLAYTFFFFPLSDGFLHGNISVCFPFIDYGCKPACWRPQA